jgi:DNA-binding transcriptional LysR family regulator
MLSRGSLDDPAAFAAVARALSFTRAAAELRLSTSALSHTIKGLETRLGLRLLQRNSRSVSVTAAGERLLRTLGPARSEIDSAIEQLGRERDLVSGSVRLTATRHAFETVIRPVLAGFLASHPQAQVEVLIDYQLRNIIAERLDAGIRIGEKLEKDMISVGVGPQLRMAVVASPGYLAAHPEDQAGAYLASGRLERLLKEWTPPFPGYFLYYSSRRQMPPTLAALIAALRRGRSKGTNPLGE